MPPRLLVVLCAACAFVSFGAMAFLGASRESSRKIGMPSERIFRQSVKEEKRLHREKWRAEPMIRAETVQLRALTELLWGSAAHPVSKEEGRLAVMEAINRMDAMQIEAMLEREVETLDFYRMAHFELRFAARRFSEIAPERAAALWLKHRSNAFMANLLLDPWASADPKAFVSWATGLPSDLQDGLGSTLARVARIKPEEFATVVRELGDSALGVPGVISAMMSLHFGDAARVFKYANGLPEGAIRDSALAMMARWPGLELDEYPEIAEAIARLHPDTARRLGEQLSESRNATDQVKELPPGVLRESAYSSLFMSRVDSDPADAVRRLERLAGTQDYPAAVRGFVAATAREDPAAAAEWALSIGPESIQQRRAALEISAAAWFKANPAEARAWVERAPLSEQEYFLLTGRVRKN